METLYTYAELLCFYSYMLESFVLTGIILAIAGLIAYGIYRVIIWKMGDYFKRIFHRILMVIASLLIAFFFSDMIFSLISIHQINKQMGFSYATPDTPEGELFLIRKVTPGKIMDKSGVKAGDHVQLYAVNDLYRLFLENQNREVAIKVKRNKELIDITINVPNLDVPFKRMSFIIMMIE